MAAHLYWRVRFTRSSASSPTSQDIWLEEVAFLLSGGVEPPYAGGVALSGGNYSALYPAANAFDRQSGVTHQWASTFAAYPAWIGYSFASAQEVVGAQMAVSADPDSYDECPVDGGTFLDWSDNGTTWTEVSDALFSGRSVPGAVVNLTSLSAVRSAAFLRTVSALSFGGGAYANVGFRDSLAHRHVYWGGTSSIVGTTKVENMPTGPRQVRLFDKQTSSVVAETWSEAGTGNYAFHNLASDREYFAVAHDYTRAYNAVVADMLVPS